MGEAERIAKALTDPMKDAIFFPNGYRDPNTSKALRKRGLVIGCALTPLGLEVRAALLAPTPPSKEQSDD